MTKLITLLPLMAAFFISPFAFAAKVNINTADAPALAAGLVGVGSQKAEAIVKYREEHGPFKAASDLADVAGIGPATVEKNMEQIAIEDEKTQVTQSTDAAVSK
jgi:competence protein ComEA